LQLVDVGIFNQVNNFLICFEDEKSFDNHVQITNNFIINDYEFIYGLQLILTIYQTTVLVTLNSIL
jgi:hypothetical protein